MRGTLLRIRVEIPVVAQVTHQDIKFIVPIRALTTKEKKKNQIKTAAARVVVHKPFLSPSADWQTFLVLMILPLVL